MFYFASNSQKKNILFFDSLVKNLCSKRLSQQIKSKTLMKHSKISLIFPIKKANKSEK